MSLPSGGKSNSMCVPSIGQSIGTEQDSVVQSRHKHEIPGSKPISQSNLTDKVRKLAGNEQLSNVPRRSQRLADNALKLADKT